MAFSLFPLSILRLRNKLDQIVYILQLKLTTFFAKTSANVFSKIQNRFSFCLTADFCGSFYGKFCAIRKFCAVQRRNQNLPIWWLFKFRLLLRLDMEWMSCGWAWGGCCFGSIIIAEPDELIRPELVGCGWFRATASAVELAWRCAVFAAFICSFWLLSWFVTVLVVPLLFVFVLKKIINW